MADELKPYTCTYQFEGRPFGFTCHARSWEEVSARFRAIGMTAVVNGEQIAEVGAGMAGDGLGRAMVAVRAIRKRRGGRPS